MACPVVTVGVVTDDTIPITWGAVAGATSYMVSLYSNAGLTTPVFGWPATTGLTAADLNNLNPGTQYWFVVDAQVGGVWSTGCASGTATTTA